MGTFPVEHPCMYLTTGQIIRSSNFYYKYLYPLVIKRGKGKETTYQWFSKLETSIESLSYMAFSSHV